MDLLSSINKVHQESSLRFEFAQRDPHGEPAWGSYPTGSRCRYGKRARAPESCETETNNLDGERCRRASIAFASPHFFRYFVKKPIRRSPLINRGYWLRMHAVETVLVNFLDKSTDKKKVVVNLGCG
ncbi:MAG: hypothetical protein Q9207_001465 [Kuettlingeria erythrocarpa]